MSAQKNEQAQAPEPDILRRIKRSTNLAPDPVKKIFNDEKSLATIEGEDKDVTVHLDMPRELWDLSTEIIFTQHRLFMYEQVKHYLEAKLAEGVKQDIRKISGLGIFSLPDSMEEEDC